MGKLGSLLDAINKHSFQPLFRKAVGWKDIQSQVDCIYYILNNGLPISDFPKSTGVLREVQLADAELLRIFHEICEKHGLRYWLAYGTLLGSVRHKGFIPWDDDLDVGMLREDYEKAYEILVDEMSKYGFEVIEQNGKRIWISNWQAGVMLDVFPLDAIKKQYVKSKEDLIDRTVKYRKYYLKNEKRKTSEQLREAKERMIGPLCEASDDCWIYRGPEFMVTKKVITYDTLFPLNTGEFENHFLYIPAKTEEYLELIYGDYMSYPKWGMLHHKGASNGVFNNPVKYNFDMYGYLSELKKLHIEK